MSECEIEKFCEVEMKQFPSIFNDVIGPVMIGQSSSHTAAAVRIGNVIRQLAGGETVKEVGLSFDRESSLATTYCSQGSDIGLLSGLMGFETYDRRIYEARELAEAAGIAHRFEVRDIGAGHPNAYYIAFTSVDGSRTELTALSVGGGMIEVTEYMGFPVSVDGGFHETLILCDGSQADTILQGIDGTLREGERILSVAGIGGRTLISIKTEEETDFAFPGAIISRIRPVLPVLSQIAPGVPFITAGEIAGYARESGLPLWKLAVLYESERSGLTQEAVFDKMKVVVETLRQSLQASEENKVKDRILQNQAGLIGRSKSVLGGSFNRNVIKYVTRFMDIKTSMGVFVAAPTAGACGAVSGCVFALSEELGIDGDEIAKAMLAAGLVGALIAHHSTFAAEVGGCQAECGAGSGMCAAACAEILGAPAEVCLSAASMALQNIFGLVCDPVGNKVEVPCLGKNIMSAFNAIACANMAAAGFDEVIPLDETIAAMDSVGRSIPRELRCTGLGGLSQTKTSQEISNLARDSASRC